MGEIRVFEVTNKRDLLRFIDFPNQLYKESPYYVPCLRVDELESLTPGKNPALAQVEQKLFLAQRDGKIVGRIGAILQYAYNEKVEQKRIRFTRFDFIDDKQVSAKLMQAVEQFAREKGMEIIHGPMGCTDFDKQGMLVEGFEEMGMFITYYNHPYYLEHMQALGFEKEVDWVESYITVPEQINPRIDALAQATIKRFDLWVPRFKTMKEIEPYIPEAFNLLDEAYGPLYGVVPLTEEMKKYYTKQFLTIISPDFISLVFDKHKQLVGIGVAGANISKAVRKTKGRLLPFGIFHLLQGIKRPEGLDLYLVGVRPGLQGKGINAILMNEVLQGAVRRGIHFAETGPQLETNQKVQTQFKYFASRQHKRRRCYMKRLDG